MSSDDVARASRLIERKQEDVDNRDYFGVLGVPSDAAPDVIQQAYFGLAKLFHPDKIDRDGLTPDEVERGRVIFEFMTESYNLLQDAGKRSALARGTSDDSGGAKKRNATDEARIFFHKASKMLRMRDWEKAEMYLRQAISREPENPEFLCQLGWATFNNMDRVEDERLEEAKGYWMKALEKDDTSVDGNYYMSLYFKSVGDTFKQSKHLKRALDFNPNFVDAQRELRLIDMRAKKKKSGGFLAKIFPSLLGK